MVAVAVRDMDQAVRVIARGLHTRGMHNPKLVSRIEDLPSRSGDTVMVVNERVAPLWYVGSSR
jgi:hypothetical protein